MSDESISSRLRRSRDSPSEEFSRGFAYESIREHLFGRRRESTFGRYRLEEPIGRGGMGEVYSAYDPELDRRVAIKRVGRRGRGGSENQRLGDALMEDARAAARVRHPNVVEIHDCGVEDDELYVVMELLEGPNLEQWLATPRPWREILERFIQAGRGLAAVHAHDIVHRDFKPSNVLLGPDGRARVADFGLASAFERLMTDPDEAAQSSGGSGSVVGTIQYMAPEQYRGVGIGPRADQFAFCNALYRALFRASPFADTTLEQLATNVLEGRLRAPEKRHGAPRTLVRVVMQGLARDPADRHPSMDALLESLRAIMSRRRRMAWMASAAAIATSGLAVGFAWPRAEAPGPCSTEAPAWTTDERSTLVSALERRPGFEAPMVEQTIAALDEHARRWSDARLDACEDTRVRSEQSDELMDLRIACSNRQRATMRAVWSLLAADDGPTGLAALALVEQMPPASECNADLVRERAKMAMAFRSATDRSRSPRAEATWREQNEQLTAARSLGHRGLHQQASRQARAVARIAEEHGLRYLLADALLVQGFYGALGSRTEAELEQSLNALRRAVPRAIESGGARLAAEAYLALAQRDHRLSHDAATLFLANARAHAMTLPSAHNLLVRIETAHGFLELGAGMLDEAALHFERALMLGGGAPWSWDALMGRAEVMLERDELDGAEQTLEDLRARLEHADPSYPLLATVLHNLALVKDRRGDLAASEQLIRRAQALLIEHGRADSLEMAAARVQLARTLRQQDAAAEARPLLQEAIEILEGGPLRNRPRLMQALDERVELELELGEPAAAVRVAERWLELARSEDHPAQLAKARMMLAKASMDAGDLQRAELELSHAQDSALELRPIDRAEIAFRRAQVAYERGRDRALTQRLLDEALTIVTELGYDAAVEDIRSWATERGFNDVEPAPQ